MNVIQNVQVITLVMVVREETRVEHVARVEGYGIN